MKEKKEEKHKTINIKSQIQKPREPRRCHDLVIP